MAGQQQQPPPQETSPVISTLDARNQATIPHLDGPNDLHRGDVVPLAAVGLDRDADAAAIADLLLTGTVSGPDRQRLRRYAVVTLLETPVNLKARTQACAMWLEALYQAAETLDEAHAEALALELDEAHTALHHNGGSRLVARHARQFARLTDGHGDHDSYHDLRQAGYIGLLRRVKTWRSAGGASFANWSNQRISDEVQTQCRVENFPEVPPTAWRSRPTMLKMAIEASDREVDPKELYAEIATAIGATSPAAVASVLEPAEHVMLSTPLYMDGDSIELGATLSDDTASTVEDVIVERDEADYMAAVLARTLAPTEADVLARVVGLSRDPESVMSIAQDHGRSRSWGSDQLARAKAKANHPGFLAELNSNRPGRGAPITRISWLADLSDRHITIGQLVFGLGGQTPLDISPRKAIVATARRLTMSPAEVRWVVLEIAEAAEAAGQPILTAFSAEQRATFAEAAQASALLRADRIEQQQAHSRPERGTAAHTIWAAVNAAVRAAHSAADAGNTSACIDAADEAAELHRQQTR
jgi:DNA-directed RNA polymerase sigma subunit (sigma70/sigma32)